MIRFLHILYQLCAASAHFRSLSGLGEMVSGFVFLQFYSTFFYPSRLVLVTLFRHTTLAYPIPHAILYCCSIDAQLSIYVGSFPIGKSYYIDYLDSYTGCHGLGLSHEYCKVFR